MTKELVDVQHHRDTNIRQKVVSYWEQRRWHGGYHVPSSPACPSIEVLKTCFHSMPCRNSRSSTGCIPHNIFGRDQLTYSRTRGAQKARVNSLSPLARLDGLVPCCEDWHTKVNLLGVSSEYWYIYAWVCKVVQLMYLCVKYLCVCFNTWKCISLLHI